MRLPFNRFRNSAAAAIKALSSSPSLARIRVEAISRVIAPSRAAARASPNSGTVVEAGTCIGLEFLGVLRVLAVKARLKPEGAPGDAEAHFRNAGITSSAKRRIDS